jgi:hypothetical protein
VFVRRFLALWLLLPAACTLNPQGEDPALDDRDFAGAMGPSDAVPGSVTMGPGNSEGSSASGTPGEDMALTDNSATNTAQPGASPTPGADAPSANGDSDATPNQGQVESPNMDSAEPPGDPAQSGDVPAPADENEAEPELDGGVPAVGADSGTAPDSLDGGKDSAEAGSASSVTAP